ACVGEQERPCLPHRRRADRHSTRRGERARARTELLAEPRGRRTEVGSRMQPDQPPRPRPARSLPSALDAIDEMLARAGGRRFAVFLDYDGTLTPIVERPELAVLSETMREAVRRLGERALVAIVSGRDLDD